MSDDNDASSGSMKVLLATASLLGLSLGVTAAAQVERPLSESAKVNAATSSISNQGKKSASIANQLKWVPQSNVHQHPAQPTRVPDSNQLKSNLKDAWGAPHSGRGLSTGGNRTGILNQIKPRASNQWKSEAPINRSALVPAATSVSGSKIDISPQPLPPVISPIKH